MHGEDSPQRIIRPENYGDGNRGVCSKGTGKLLREMQASIKENQFVWSERNKPCPSVGPHINSKDNLGYELKIRVQDDNR